MAPLLTWLFFYQLVFPVHSFTGGKGVSVVHEAIWNGKLGEKLSQQLARWSRGMILA